jgi:hypothetical protein
MIDEQTARELTEAIRESTRVQRELIEKIEAQSERNTEHSIRLEEGMLALTQAMTTLTAQVQLAGEI